MDRPAFGPADVVAILLAVAVLGYHLVITQQPLIGAVLGVWIILLQLALRQRRREHALVIFGLGLFVLVGLFSGILWLYMTNLIVACSAYTIYTLKYAPVSPLTN